MKTHQINLNITLDNENMPEHIDWSATDTANETPNQVKAIMLSLWDANESAAMRIDLWTKRMRVDEMNDFMFQTLVTMADTYTRATKNETLSNELKEFAGNFKKKADEIVKQQEQK
ncbi:MAG TPA: gliding motility protein GldC [Edaphocola sp.]|nr:gliding motility protein GldC [Edaphocola sp.]